MKALPQSSGEQHDSPMGKSSTERVVASLPAPGLEKFPEQRRQASTAAHYEILTLTGAASRPLP